MFKCLTGCYGCRCGSRTRQELLQETLSGWNQVRTDAVYSKVTTAVSYRGDQVGVQTTRGEPSFYKEIKEFSLHVDTCFPWI